jgi:site-specific recombinase XerD
MGRTLAEKVPGFVNPAREVKPPKFEVSKPKALKESEVLQVKQRASDRVGEKRSYTRVRNETILHLLLDTGLRAEELRLLRREQLDEEIEWLSSVRTKGRRYRNVYVTSAMRPRLKAYLEARATELRRFFPKLSSLTDKALPLFISSYRANPAKPESFFMGAKTLWRAVHECSAELDLHPHLLRHSFALELLEHSGDIRLVSQALGHGDTKVTMRYTERRGEEVARALEKMRVKKGK